jgi:hypothetical protein
MGFTNEQKERLKAISDTWGEVFDWRKGRSTFDGTQKEHLNFLTKRYDKDVLFLLRLLGVSSDT